MDEPLAALDMTLKRDLLAYLARIPEHWDLPVLYVTHAPGEALALGSAMLLLQAGRLAAQGPVAPTLAEARRLGLLPMDTFYPTERFSMKHRMWPDFRFGAALAPALMLLALTLVSGPTGPTPCSAAAGAPAVTTGLGYKAMVQDLCALYARKTGQQPAQMYSGNIGQMLEQVKAGQRRHHRHFGQGQP